MSRNFEAKLYSPDNEPFYGFNVMCIIPGNSKQSPIKMEIKTEDKLIPSPSSIKTEHSTVNSKAIEIKTPDSNRFKDAQIRFNNCTLHEIVQFHKLKNGCYKCKFCGRQLLNLANLKNHLRLHTGDWISKCRVCSQGFVAVNKCQDHEKKHENVEECSKCLAKFKSDADWQVHIYGNTCIPKVIDCRPCGLSFSDDFEQDQHLRSFHQLNVNNVSMVLVPEASKGKTYTREELHEMHKEVNGVFECKVCGRRLMEKCFDDHLRLHTKEWVEYCKICKRGFNYKSCFRKHMKLHATSKSPIGRGLHGKSAAADMCKCDKCGKEFKAKRFLINHFESKKCPYFLWIAEDGVKESNKSHKAKAKNAIGDRYLTETVIRENNFTIDQLFRKHKMEKNGQYHCKICRLYLSNKDKFLLHLRRHTSNFVMQCKFCEKGFFMEFKLKEHERICGPFAAKKTADTSSNNNPDNLPSCQICHLRFANTAQLSFHNQQFKDFHDSTFHIGDIPLTEEIIRTNKYTTEQVFRSHQLIDGHYQCKICGKKITNRKKNFKVHLRRHTGEVVARCEICDIGFYTGQHYKVHAAGHKTTNKCEVCGVKFEMESELIEHMESGKCSCKSTTDEDRMDTKSRRKIHRTNFNEIKNPPLNLNGQPLTDELIKEKKFSLQQVVDYHTEMNGGGYECKVCQKKILNKTIFRNHLRQHTSANWIVSCKYCENIFKSHRSYRHHKAHMKKCQKCGSDFETELAWIAHLEEQTCKQKMHTCLICGLKFLRNSGLKMHSEKFHKRREEKHEITMAVIEKKKYSREQLYRMHQATDYGIITCKVCAKDVAEKTFMDHLLLHTRDSLVYCKICSTGFITDTNYEMHMKTHTEQVFKTNTSFECNKCDRRFESNVSLQLHRRYCDYSDEIGDIQLTEEIIRTKKYTLNQLCTSHKSEDGSFKCRICGYSAIAKYNLKRHLEGHMQSEPRVDIKQNKKTLDKNFTATTRNKKNNYDVMVKKEMELSILNSSSDTLLNNSEDLHVNEIPSSQKSTENLQNGGNNVNTSQFCINMQIITPEYEEDDDKAACIFTIGNQRLI